MPWTLVTSPDGADIFLTVSEVPEPILFVLDRLADAQCSQRYLPGGRADIMRVTDNTGALVGYCEFSCELKLRSQCCRTGRSLSGRPNTFPFAKIFDIFDI